MLNAVMTVQDQYIALLELAYQKDIEVQVQRRRSDGRARWNLVNVVSLQAQHVTLFDQATGMDIVIPLKDITALMF